MILHCKGPSSWILIPVVQDLALFKINLIYAARCCCLLLHVSCRTLIYVKEQIQDSNIFVLFYYVCEIFFPLTQAVRKPG